MKTISLNLVISVATTVIMLTGLIIGYTLGMATERSKPACHSKTEDSVITDCNYSNGAWYRK